MATKTQFNSLFMVGLLIVAGMAVLGWALPGQSKSSCPSSPASPCWTHVQKGFTTCTINSGAQSCTKVISFSPAYAMIPYLETELNATCGANCQSTASYTLNPSVIPLDGELVFQAANITWTNMPNTNTELNGFADQRMAWTTPSSFSSQTGTFCVSGGTSVGASSFTVQSSTNQASWTNLGSDGILVSPASGSTTCTTETISLSTLTQYFFRVLGNDAFGPSNDQFGTIELYISGSYQQASIAGSSACLVDLVAETVSSATLGTTCGRNAISSTETFTMDWWAGIPA